MPIEVVRSLDALPADARALLGGDGFFSTETWYRLIGACALPPMATPEFLVCRTGSNVAMLPMRRDGRALAGLTTPYTCRFAPLGGPDMTRQDWTAVGVAIGRHLRAWPSVRLDALDDDDRALPGLLAGLAQAGLVVRCFDHFGNWHESVAGQDWAGYLARRPGQLRQTLRRKARKAGDLRFELIEGGPRLAAGIDAYALVYARSWKEAEPFAAFAGCLMRASAEAGVLRLGLCWRGGDPVAAQIWVVHAGHATVHKLAHDDAAKADSPGTLLTAFVLQSLLDGSGLTEVDFGRGDDAYKRSWAGSRRQRVGVLAINPRQAAGAWTLARQWLGEVRRRVRGASVQANRQARQNDPETERRQPDDQGRHSAGEMGAGHPKRLAGRDTKP